MFPQLTVRGAVNFLAVIDLAYLPYVSGNDLPEPSCTRVATELRPLGRLPPHRRVDHLIGMEFFAVTDVSTCRLGEILTISSLDIPTFMVLYVGRGGSQHEWMRRILQQPGFFLDRRPRQKHALSANVGGLLHSPSFPSVSFLSFGLVRTTGPASTAAAAPSADSSDWKETINEIL
jgi:hypothetical protein